MNILVNHGEKYIIVKRICNYFYWLQLRQNYKRAPAPALQSTCGVPSPDVIWRGHVDLQSYRAGCLDVYAKNYTRSRIHSSSNDALCIS